MYQKRNRELGILNLYLGDYNRQFYLREISKLTKIPLKTTQNVVSIFERNKILKGIKSGKNKYLKLNLDNIQTKFLILQSEVNKTILFLDKYPLLKAFLKEIDTDVFLIVFGSFARLEADKNSDLDLLVTPGKKLPLHLLPYKIHKIELSEDSFIISLRKQEALIKEIKENHIILNNHSFYVNAMWSYYG